MAKYQQILATTDFSDISRAAIQRASVLSEQNGCRLVILHVIEHFPLDIPLGSVFQSEVRPDEYFVVAARKKMRSLLEGLGLGDAEAEIILTAQSARKAILEYAGEGGFDLIVVAPQGRGLMESLGSTAIGVVNGAACDVLVVRPAAAG